MSSYSISSSFQETVTPKVQNDSFPQEADKLVANMNKLAQTHNDPTFGAQRFSYHHVNKQEREQAIESISGPSARVPKEDFMRKTFNESRKNRS